MDETVLDLLAANTEHADAFEGRFADLQDGQAPAAVTVCCSDSRVLQDAMWGNDEPGRLFSVGNIGNRVVQRTESGEAVSGDVLYPIEHTGTETGRRGRPHRVWRRDGDLRRTDRRRLRAFGDRTLPLAFDTPPRTRCPTVPRRDRSN